MKFITEEDLRDLYRKQPFTDYDLKEGERLTPGARQFLVDRGVDMYDRNDPGADIEKGKRSKGGCADIKKKLFSGRFKSLKALFLLTARDVMERDVCMSQQVAGLYRQFAALCPDEEGRCAAADLNCNACSGINAENFSKCIGDCFEITEFHMQMEKGKEMLLLARLRSELEVFGAELEELLCEDKLRQEVLHRLNQIINTLSQMICSAMGGRECQRKI